MAEFIEQGTGSALTGHSRQRSPQVPVNPIERGGFGAVEFHRSTLLEWFCFGLMVL
jgi:hypothetical protein